MDELHLFGLPIAVNLDDKPGPDAVNVRIYATSGSAAKGRRISNGTIELLMFDGVAQDLSKSQPKHVWAFSADELKAFESQNTLGTGYLLLLRWGYDQPQGRALTVVARYVDGKRAPVYSSASTISLTVK